MRVRIKKLPNAAYGGQQADGALDVTPTAWGGADAKDSKAPNMKASKTLTKVPRSEANLEAEGGETAFGPISGDTIPDHMVIKGPRHSSGGVPLNLPEDTFIFSDTKAMKITDPKVLRIFGKTRKKGGYTPAELAKPYDIQKYKAILMDPDSDRKDRENAELMIKNYIMKLGALAIAQESKKGFPQGIPEMARPYMEANGISEEDLMPQEEEPQQQMPQEGMAEGGTPEYPHGGFHTPFETMMEKQKENDFTKLSSPESLLTGPQGQYTKDEVLSNPLTGEEPALRMDTEGELYETKKQEGTPGRDITFEQKINDAYDIDMNALADQGAFFAGAATNFGNQLQNAKRMKSIFDRSMDPDARENVFSGLHYANTPGVVAPSGVSPTSVQSYRSQYGGELDKFVYGGDDPVNPNQFDRFEPMAEINTFDKPAAGGTRDFTTHFTNTSSQPIMREQPVYDPATDPNLTKNYMTNRKGEITGQAYIPAGQSYNTRKLNRQFKRGKVQGESFYDGEYGYGGIPMAMYGADMGGSYFPIMSTGGSSRVRITALPGFDNGGTYEEATPISKDEWNNLGPEWELRTDAQGRKWKVKIVNGKEVAKVKLDWQAGEEDFEGTDEQYLKSIACDKIKASGMTVEEFIADANARGLPKLWDYSNSEYNAMLKECEAKGEEGDIQGRKYEEDDEPQPDPKKEGCQCKELDSQGNWTGKYIYYEGTINEETGELECPPCDYEEEILEEGAPEPTRWSDRAIGNLITQARLRTDAARVDPTLVNRPEYSPVLQRRYDQDIQSNLAGLRKSIDTGGGTAQQKLFQNLAALDQATTKVGQRQKATEDYNINVLNQAAQIAANLQAGTDAKNQAYLDRARLYNVGAIDKETAARNAKMQAINLAKTDAQNEMLQKATWNFNNPEYKIDYKTGLPYFNPNYKDPTGSRGNKDIVTEYEKILSRLGAGNEEVAYNLAVKRVYGNQKSQFGGYVSGNDMYPFFND